MLRHLPQTGALILVFSMLLGGLLPPSAGAQPPTKKRVKKERATPQKARVVPGNRPAQRRTRPRKSYVRTRRDYGHVRVTRRHRRDDGKFNIRPIIVRSSRVTPVVLDRFEDQGRDQIRMIVRHFREGRRPKALEIWGGLIDTLAEYREPIDLDDVMLYIAREGCIHDNDTFMYHAAKLEFLRESQERLQDYIVLLNDQRDACMRGGRRCSSETLRGLETELIRARADREIIGVKARVTSDEFEKIIESSRDYEHRFAVAFEDMYREVELRIRWAP